MTTINGHGSSVRVDQLVRVATRWHAPGQDWRTLCGADIPDGPAVLSVPEGPEEDPCRIPACAMAWGAELRRDGRPLEEPAPLDALDMDGDDRPLNPTESEAGIRKCARMLWLGIRVVSDAERDFREKDAAYDRAFALAYLAYHGPVHEKKQAAERDTQQERDARDVAELAYRHADRRQRALLAQLDAVRSINTSVRAMYAAETGVGR